MNAISSRGLAFGRSREQARPARILADGLARGVPSNPFDDVAAPPLRRASARSTGLDVPGSASKMVAPGSLAVEPVVLLQNPVAPDATATPTAEAQPAHALQPPPRHPVTARAQVGWATLFGLLTAAGIVAVALAFRSEFDAPAPSGDLRTTAPAAPEAAVADMSQATVRLRFGMDLPAGRVEALQAALAAAGVGSVVLAPMPIPVERSRIEYFDASARPMAETLARLLEPLTGSVAPARDLAGLAAVTESGRLDLWIAS